MKRNFGVKMTLLACTLGATSGLLPLAQPVAHAQGAGRINVLLNGRLLSFGNVPPEQVSGRVLVPLRAVFEALGATLDFDAATNKIFAVRGATQVQLQIGSTLASVNGVAKTLDVPAQTRFNRTLVPLRFVSEALGADVSWNETQRTVYLSTTGAGTPPVGAPTAVPTPIPAPTDPVGYPGTMLNGTVTGVTPARQTFLLRTPKGTITVRMTSALPAWLNYGDVVRADGYFSNKTFFASRVTLVRERVTKLNATVVSILSNRRLIVSSGNLRFTVNTAEVLAPTINVGDTVLVAGTKVGSTFNNSTVTLSNAVPVVAGQPIDFLGAVASINVGAGSLRVRGDNGQLYTVYYARPNAFPVGTRVRVIGSYANGATTARSVTRQ